MARFRGRVAELPGVASALPATAASATMRSVLSLLERMFTILELVIGTLAFLVAFNASRVAADERRREHASMLAFGVPLWRVLALGVTESLLLHLDNPDWGFRSLTQTEAEAPSPPR